MLLAVGLAMIIVLLVGIGAMMSILLQQTALVNRSLQDLAGLVGESNRAAETEFSQAELADPIQQIGILLAYVISQNESPLSGLSAEPDITFEINMPKTELKLLYRARQAWRYFAGG